MSHIEGSGELERLVAECENSRLMAWAGGRETVEAGPWLVYINPTNICSNRCVMCPHDEAMRPERGHMPMELFERIVDQLPAGVRKVYLLKQGEPFLNKRLPDMIAHLKTWRPDIHVAVICNATVPLADKLDAFMPHLDSLGLSISALSPETYRAIHGTEHHGRVQDNLAALDAWMAQADPETRPHVYVAYVRQRANMHEGMEEVFEHYRANYPNLCSMDFHPLFNWQGYIEEGNPDLAGPVEDEALPCCIYPWSTLTICHDGKVAYCQEECREDHFLGDLTEQSLMEVWNGEAFRRFRRRLAAGRYSELWDDGFLCRECSYLWDCHSQSPQNLAQGYAMGLGQREPSFGNLLALPAAELAELAAKWFLQGELHKTAGCLAHFGRAGAPGELRAPLDRLRVLVDRVLAANKGHYERKVKPGETGRPTYFPLPGGLRK